jgi:hypothetical protein
VTQPEWRDILLVLAAFWLPPLGIYLVIVWRSWRRFKLSERSYRPEGYPPPDPPTTDSEPQKPLP